MIVPWHKLNEGLIFYQKLYSYVTKSMYKLTADHNGGLSKGNKHTIDMDFNFVH